MYQNNLNLFYLILSSIGIMLNLLVYLYIFYFLYLYWNLLNFFQMVIYIFFYFIFSSIFIHMLQYSHLCYITCCMCYFLSVHKYRWLCNNVYYYFSLKTHRPFPFRPQILYLINNIFINISSC